MLEKSKTKAARSNAAFAEYQWESLQICEAFTTQLS